ncbi:MAG: sugar phosphate nucleotidyltransferase, partial [Bacteroidota bacterium]
MKVIIPVAGAGTRLRPLTYTQPKALIPVAGKPIISYIIDQLVEKGINDFVFVIGYLGEKIKNYIDATYPELSKEFVIQENRLGSAHAIWVAREFWQDSEEVIIFFGDVILDFNLQFVLDSPYSVLAIKKVKDPREFGVVELDDNEKVTRVIEKPKIPKSDMAMVGFYKIREVKHLARSLEFVIKSNKRNDNEFPLTDSLMNMIEEGVDFKTLVVDNWYNCGKKEVLLEANALLLDKLGYGEDYP